MQAEVAAGDRPDINPGSPRQSAYGAHMKSWRARQDSNLRPQA